MRKSPNFVGSFAAASFSTRLSSSSLRRMISSMVITVNPCSLANPRSSVVRIMVPSSLMISQQRPHSFSPASFIRSTVASVCPARLRTPPSLASSGNICPGLRKSSGFAPSSTVFTAVKDLSNAEIPVVVSTWSMDTVKAVEWLSVFTSTIWLSPSFSHILRLMGIQISPFARLAMAFTFSGVAYSAAQIRSPSFSLSGSSITRISFPSLRSCNACSSLPNCSFSSITNLLLRNIL